MCGVRDPGATKHTEELQSEKTWRQSVLHDQRGGAEVQHPPADAPPLRARGAAQAVAHRRQHAALLGGGPRAARNDSVAHPRSRGQSGRRRDHPQHAQEDRAHADRSERIHGVREARAGARHRRLGAVALDGARQVVADRSRSHDAGGAAETRRRHLSRQPRLIYSQRMPCELCDDTHWKPIDEHGVRRVVRCDCWRDSLGHQRLGDANIPRRYQHCTIANFTAYNESLERAGVQARRVAEAFPAITKGLFLEGQPGVGKTHLAVAVLKQVIQTTGARGLFYDTRDLLRVIRSTYDPSIRTTELEILRPVMTADLLVLDDLGAEKTSEWVEETMNLIVNTRYNERRLTIFTSNYLDIPDDSDPNSLVFRIGFRMRSRLHEMCDFIVLDGADYRQIPANGGPDDLLMLWKTRKKVLPSPGRGRQARAQLREGVRDGR